MSFLPDYLSSSGSEDYYDDDNDGGGDGDGDDDGVTRVYVRPVYLKRRPQTKKPAVHPVKREIAVPPTKPRTSHQPRISRCTGPPCEETELLQNLNLDLNTNSPEQTPTPVYTSTAESSRKYKLEGDQYFEYGETINGYKFVAHKNDRAKLENAQAKRTRPQEGPSDLCDPGDSIDPLVFDRGSHVSKRLRSSDTSRIKEYWQSTAVRVPVPTAPELSAVSEEEITRGDISNFYRKSSELLGKPMLHLLKQERVAWHPDKMSRRIGHLSDKDSMKITRIFQIVNELWEENASL